MIQQLLQERIEAKAKPFQSIDESILQMLKRLREETDVKLGLISNAASEEVDAWATCSLAPFFDDVIFSYVVGAAKPAEQIYHLACERLDVLAGVSLFVGDGGSNELLGAKKAGLRPLWAVWFLNRWPKWKMSEQARQENSQFRKLTSPGDLNDVLLDANWHSNG